MRANKEIKNELGGTFINPRTASFDIYLVIFVEASF